MLVDSFDSSMLVHVVCMCLCFFFGVIVLCVLLYSRLTGARDRARSGVAPRARGTQSSWFVQSRIIMSA